MRKLGLLFLFISLAGCGRGQSDLYRAYNISPMHDSSGKITEDLASQNRHSLQSSGEYTYLYVAPEQAGNEDKNKSATADETKDESDSQSEDLDAGVPDDAATTDLPDDAKQAVVDKIDDLKDAVSALNKK